MKSFIFLVALILSVSAFSAVITCVKCNTQFDDRYTHGCGRNSDGSISILMILRVPVGKAAKLSDCQQMVLYVYNPFTKTYSEENEKLF
jgi:hypothetical protein